jgi:hypothetical protein
MSEKAVNPREADQGLPDQGDVAPWCQAHWADVVCPSVRAAAAEQDRHPAGLGRGDAAGAASAPVVGPRQVSL